MAITAMTAFESQNILTDPGFSIGVGGTAMAYSSTQARTGTWSIRCNPASGVNQSGGHPLGNFNHFGLYCASLPTVERRFAGVIAANSVNLRMTSAGAIAVYVNTTLLGTSSAAFASPGWHWIGYRGGNASGSVVYLKIDGVDEVTSSTTSSVNSGTYGCAGTEASAIDLYFDDFLQDDTGFLEPSKVALLLPISDNARATLWTGGTGGTTNLWDAVNNTPPVGTATETDTTQIEHAGGAAGTTDAYDANMTTYTTAGVNTGDTVLAVQGTVSWGEDSATGTKLLGFSGVSNPSWTGLASADVSFGHGSAALGTWAAGADGWNENRSAVSNSPSVTLGTSPVMRVVRPETATRVASVCYMAMHVAWTPAAVVAEDPMPYISGGYYP